MVPRIAVVFFSTTGNIHAMAHALSSDAKEYGAEARTRRVAELAPPEAIASNPRWRAYADAVAEDPVAETADLEW
jgi:NAD(P)H dehydrogenase (quinone)